MDVQPESAGLQHFKKQGPLAIWLVLGNLFILYMGVEYLFQHYTDDENFRKPLPPPMDYPNPATTPDTKLWNFSKTETYRQLVDSGHVTPIAFKIENGKKVYNRFAGVNKPMPRHPTNSTDNTHLNASSKFLSSSAKGLLALGDQAMV